MEGTMDVFIVRALKKIKKETSRKQKDIKDECEKVLAEIQKHADSGAPPETDADKYFGPLKLACLSKNPKMMEAALDCIQKLIAYNFLRGIAKIEPKPLPEGKEKTEGDEVNQTPRTLIDEIIEVICSCNDSLDDSVQLQVIKALLTAVTSQSCEVHETSLLLAVRACYHIHLVSKNMVNKTTAKAILTQMLNAVFQKMESYDQKKKLAGGSEADANQNSNSPSEEAPAPAADTPPQPPSSRDSSEHNPSPPAPPTQDTPPQETTSSAQDVAVPALVKSESAESKNDSDVADSKPTEESAAPEQDEKLFGDRMYGGVQRTLGYVSPKKKAAVPELSSALATENVPETATASEKEPNETPAATEKEANATSAPATSPTAKEQISAFPSIFHKDAFLLFRSLCKISMKALPDDPNQIVDPIALQSKILSLELIHSILESAGPSFRSGEKFIYAIRQYLCMSLIKNCTSNITQVVNLSLRIFVVLIKNFKDHLKAEFEVFISNIFLRILESQNSTFEHKMLVLEVFFNLSQDALILVEIFLNYDCDWDSMDLFRRIVNALAKVGKGRSGADPQGFKFKNQEETSLKTLSLESLVNIVKSLSNVTTGSDDHLVSHTEAAAQLAERERALMKKSNDKEDIDEDKSEVPSTPGTPGVSVVESYDRKQRLKEELQTGILKFNLKPTAGIQYLIDKGHLEKTTTAVAKFLHDYADELNKTEIGDYLGREATYQDGFCIRVLHDYVDQMDFSEKLFDDAIRHFLSGFRLPGEAQKIDRIMEKFAERYCINNPGVFPTADTAFILAFSVIMLNTDLHNPSIAEHRRMTKEGFIKNNRGISSSENLPDEFLMSIYDRIQQNEITLKDDDALKQKIAQKQKTGGLGADIFGTNSALAEKQKREAFSKEREAMVQATEEMFKRRVNANKAKLASKGYLRADQVESAVRPMFEVAWAPVLAALSMALETSDDAPTVALCLKGFRHAIRISANYQMATERNAYVTSLAKFTTLDTVKEMKAKNIECIKALIAIALTEGNHLGESWGQVLQCISQITRLQMFAMGLQSDDKFFPTQHEDSRKNSRGSLLSVRKLNTTGGLFAATPTREELNKAVEEANASQINEEVDPASIDRIFSSSVTLSSEAIQEFVEQLCAVSISELSVNVASSQSHPRVFSMQKIVEVADYNMNIRPRVIWARIWETLAKHFTTIGCHENVAISMFAIDSIRQLALKFLEKDELKDFHFQKLFLRPFEVIMTNTQSPRIKELVLVCLEQLIRSKGNQIRSGWKTIFSVYTVGAGDANVELEKLAFGSVDTIVKNHIESVLDVFVDLVKCLHTFAANKEDIHVSLEAIAHLKTCLEYLAKGKVIAAVKSPEGSSTVAETSPGGEDTPAAEPSSEVSIQFNDSDAHIRVWWPVLTSFAGLVGDERQQVSDRSLDLLFSSLIQYGGLFTTKFWELVFRGVISPIFDDVRHPTHDTRSPPALLQTCNQGLQNLLKLFSYYYSTIHFLLGDVLQLLQNCICQENTDLSLIGLKSLDDFITKCGDRFDEATWTAICGQYQKLFTWSTPSEILSVQSPEELPPLFAKLSTQLVLTLKLQESVGLIVTTFIKPLTRVHCEHFLKVLYDSFYFARDFNNEYKLRVALQQAGLDLNGGELPHMLDQEVEGMKQTLRVLFSLSSDTSEIQISSSNPSLWDHRQFAEEQLIRLTNAVVSEYLARDEALLSSETSETTQQSVKDAQKIITALGPVVISTLSGFNSFTKVKFAQHIEWFYPLLTSLVLVNDRNVRTAVKDLLNNGIFQLIRR